MAVKKMFLFLIFCLLSLGLLLFPMSMLKVLLSLEMTGLGLLMLVFFLMGETLYCYILIFLLFVFLVCEAALGLGALIKFTREFGIQMVSV